MLYIFKWIKKLSFENYFIYLHKKISFMLLFKKKRNQLKIGITNYIIISIDITFRIVFLAYSVILEVLKWLLTLFKKLKKN